MRVGGGVGVGRCVWMYGCICMCVCVGGVYVGVGVYRCVSVWGCSLLQEPLVYLHGTICGVRPRTLNKRLLSSARTFRALHDKTTTRFQIPI